MPISRGGERRFRLRFTVTLLLALTTVVAVALGWNFREREFRAEGYLRLPETRGEIIPGQPPIFEASAEREVRRVAAAALDSTFLQRVVVAPEVAKLPTTLSKQDPVAWLKSAIGVEYQPGGRLLKFYITGPRPAMNDECAILDCFMETIVSSESVRRRQVIAAATKQCRDELEAVEREFVRKRERMNVVVQSIRDEKSLDASAVGELAAEIEGAKQTMATLHRRLAALRVERTLDDASARDGREFGVEILQRALCAPR